MSTNDRPSYFDSIKPLEFDNFNGKTLLEKQKKDGTNYSSARKNGESQVKKEGPIKEFIDRSGQLTASLVSLAVANHPFVKKISDNNKETKEENKIYKSLKVYSPFMSVKQKKEMENPFRLSA